MADTARTIRSIADIAPAAKDHLRMLFGETFDRAELELGLRMNGDGEAAMGAFLVHLKGGGKKRVLVVLRRDTGDVVESAPIDY